MKLDDFEVLLDMEENEMKRKRYSPTPLVEKRKKTLANDEISSDEDLSANERLHLTLEESDDEFEDRQEMAFRKAKQLLLDIREEEKTEGGGDEDAVAHRLKEEALSHVATLHRRVAKSAKTADSVVIYRAHRFSIVAVAISHDTRYICSCSKDATVVKYDVEEGKKVATLKYDKKNGKSHKGQILALAISGGDRFLVSGGVDATIRVWNFTNLELVKEFTGHKNAITGLAFRLGTQQLFSCSRDRSVKAWDLDQMGYVDTMFGHVDAVADIDVLSRERVLTCGGQDRTLRLWKVAEESQLVFNGFASSISIDCVAFINDEHFVSGSADGSLCIWSIFKKKPVCVQKEAHGRGADGQQNWIISVAARRYTDLVVSGSSDGYVRFWKVADDYKSVENIFSFELVGFINSMKFSEDGEELVCAVGQEHKSGRWWTKWNARNVVVLIPLEYAEQ
uniref:U3 small nucleolar RNA-interacting protein 2 n=1 Tax=Parascaris univalens TaxID=6257 RepID=A0A915BY08_PARUN